MFIYNNAALTTLDGLANLTSVGTTTNDYLNIQSNGALVSIASLVKPPGKLTTLSGNLTITSNTKLSVCQADAVKTSLTTGGWVRTYSGTGNLACATTCGGTNKTVCQ
jgi:hypothetical protein